MRSVTATIVCSNDSTHKETETVNTVYTVITPATCTTTGVAKYTATFANSAFTSQVKEITLDAINHNWDSVTYTWSSDLKSVTATRSCLNDESHTQSQTVVTIYTVVTPSTCTTTGIGKYTAKFTLDIFEDQTKEVVLDALNHNFNTPTYTWSSDLKSVTATIVCSNDSSHVKKETVNTVYTVITPATCTTSGVAKYTATFTNSEFTAQNKEVTLDALVHNWQSVVTLPTCETKGYTTHTCSKCNDSYVDSYTNASGHKYGNAVYTYSSDYKEATATVTCQNDPTHKVTETVNTQYVLLFKPSCSSTGLDRYIATFTNNLFTTQMKDVETSKVPHTYTSVVTQPTCDKDGYTTHTCSTCNDTYVDSIVSAKGHTNTSVVTLPTCDTQGYTTHTCSVCNKVTVDSYTNPKGHSYTSLSTPATCEAQGYTTHTCTVCSKSYVDSYTSPKGHKYGTPTYTYSSDYKEATATVTCQNDPSHKVTETVNTQYVLLFKPSCSSTGLDRYIATFTNSLFATQMKDVNISKLAHSYTSVVTNPTCSEKGYTTHTCSVCNDSYKDSYTNKLAHSMKETVVSPTCEDNGYTIHSCTNCDYTYNDTIVKATGHSYKDVTYTWSEDYQTVTATITCQNDSSHKVTETVSTTRKVLTESTCSEKGTAKYTAKFTSSYFKTQTKEVEIPTLEHDMLDATSTRPSTCSICGYTEGEPVKKGCKKSSLMSLLLYPSMFALGLYALRRRK